MDSYQTERPSLVTDTECYWNYWSISFLEIHGSRFRTFERRPDKPLDVERVRRLLRTYRVYTFNGLNYDLPMIAYALIGATNEALKQASDDIILGQLRPWEFEQKYGVKIPDWLDHIDLMEVSPGTPTKPSLKLYAGRLNSKRMQDLPIDPSKRLTPADVSVLRDYGINDLYVTRDLHVELKPQVELRASMSDKYGIDLRSKSDAQVAEAVLRTEIERRIGERIYKPGITRGSFQYKPPAFIQFNSPELRELLEAITQSSFVFDGTRMEPPPPLNERVVTIGQSRYKLGNGGIHSMESAQSLVSDDEFVLLDRDVTSYYPNIILGQRLFPSHIGETFLQVYRTIYRRRLAAKREGDKNTSETLKIVLNSSFGKFGSPYSVLYSPSLLIQTTVTGQLAILMAIEMLEDIDMRVVSANTDGIITMVPCERRDEFERVFLDWETVTGFNTEETEYAALHSRDVNSYIAIGAAGKVKTKGTFAAAGPGQFGAAGMKKNPDGEIVTTAVIEWLTKGIAIEQTICACTDIRQFLTVRRVKGGAEKDGVYLGKAIRWYQAVAERGAITTVLKGDKVPRSEGAMPCMELPETFPLDVDYDWYVREAYATLQDVGIEAADPSLAGRTGAVFARLPDQVTWHAVDLPAGRARCGRVSSIRDGWIEVAKVPDGQRLCKKCDLAL